ncbi:MAG TPA: glycosyltransferase [Gemmatimonadales bacterium]|jgi:GT2 family glycosyltransferase
MGRTLAPVALAEIELERPIESLLGLGDAVAVEALVRRRGEPVGWVRVETAGGECHAPLIRAALDGLALPAPRAVTPAPGLSVTVAVCTRDRPDDLATCLDSLERVEYPGLEVLVVDNAPSSEASRVLVEGRSGRVRYVREPRPGLDWARNRAIAESGGDVIAFTDDDVSVDPGWVRALVAAFGSDESIVAVTGLVLPAALQTEAQVLFERYRGFGRGFAPRRIGVEGRGSVARRYGAAGAYGTGANMAFRRSLFGRIGGFDPALGAGTPTRGGDDLEMFFRVLKEGHALVYEPRAIVRHRHRHSLEGLRRQIADHGVSFSSYVVRGALTYPDERLGFARLACWWWGKLAFRALWPRSGPVWALRRLALAELGGCLAGLGRYPLAKRAAARLVRFAPQSETRA